MGDKSLEFPAILIVYGIMVKSIGNGADLERLSGARGWEKWIGERRMGEKLGRH